VRRSIWIYLIAITLMKLMTGLPGRTVIAPPHNLTRPLYNLHFYILRFFFVASFPKII